jgi:hypothetical protein
VVWSGVCFGNIPKPTEFFQQLALELRPLVGVDLLWQPKVAEYALIQAGGYHWGGSIREGQRILPPSKMVGEDQNPSISSVGDGHGSHKIHSNTLPRSTGVHSLSPWSWVGASLFGNLTGLA